MIAALLLPPLVLPLCAAAARLVVVGDTGAAADGEGSHIGAEDLAAWRAAVKAEDPDLIVVPGDLIYGPDALERGPACRWPDPAERALYEQRIGARFRDLGAPVVLVVGNHDVGHARRSPAREACLRAWAQQAGPPFTVARHGQRLPLGAADLVLLDTNRPFDGQGAQEALAAAGADGRWRVAVGHHTLRTVGDKTDEDRHRAWMATLPPEHRPQLWINGHAHVLQLALQGDVAALTSGSDSKVRRGSADDPVPSCGGSAEPCPAPGLDWSLLASRPLHGYAVVDIEEAVLQARLKDVHGAPLSCHQRARGGPAWSACP